MNHYFNQWIIVNTLTWGNLIVWILQIPNCKQLTEPRVLVNAEESIKPIETQYPSDHNVCIT